ANLQKGIPAVRGDPDRLRQVIHNLLQNAQDALSGSGDPKIEVSTEHSGGQVWLRISDNGCGFPEAIIDGAFEPYVTTKPKGTGLGLAIVKRIIDEHQDRKSTRLNSSHGSISYAVFCLKKKTQNKKH